MKTLFIALSLLVSSFQLFAQVPLTENLKNATNDYTKAFIDANVDYILTTTHPNILEMGGGEEFLRKDVVGDLEGFRNSGVTYTKATASDPSDSYQVGTETFYLVPIEWTAELGSSIYKSQQHILATSSDEGKSWSFINTSKFSAKNLAVYIKGFDESIEFPAPGPLEQVN
jgi:hypothetical protein